MYKLLFILQLCFLRFQLVAKMYLELESQKKNESDRSFYLESSLLKSFELKTPVRTRLERTPETDF